jgi:hypothetical protein
MQPFFAMDDSKVSFGEKPSHLIVEPACFCSIYRGFSKLFEIKSQRIGQITDLKKSVILSSFR